MKTPNHAFGGRTLASTVCRTFLHAVLTFAIAGRLLSQIPDLTNGDPRLDDKSWNLGPTGMSGWMYRPNWTSKYGGWNTDDARQIEVMQVDVGSPADGILSVADVILGADGTGAQPVAFTSDARKAFAYAIADAEARSPAELKMLVWRAGSTSTMTVTLETLGAYSATAPYNCPKSAAILEKGLDTIMASGAKDNWNFSLVTLLAANDPSNPKNQARMDRARDLAYELILTQEEIDLYTSDTSLSDMNKIAWQAGFKLVTLAEYYLLTGDTAVYDSMRAWAIACANGQSMFGTSGHQFVHKGKDGSLNGPYARGYGVVNSANMQCFYGMLLAKEAGISDQRVQDAIQRSSTFYRAYVDRGSIPYGEHEPGSDYGDNGKSGIAALCFKMLDGGKYDANYYSAMSGATAHNLDAGHLGPWFNYLWTPLGANSGGEESMTAFFAEQKWRFDLGRNWDGTFVYNSYQNGGGANGNGGPVWSNNFQMSMAFLLPYSAPLRQTYITGKNTTDSSQWMTSAELQDVSVSSGYDATLRTTNELLSDIGSWSPVTRLAAANEIGLRTAEHATLVPTLSGMATDTNASVQSRMGACLALGEAGDAGSVSLLVGLLSDSEDLVKWSAAVALKSFSQAQKLEHIETLLAICAAESKPTVPVDPEDPIHLTHADIVQLIFASGGALSGHDLNGIDRSLLYPAIRAALTHPRGRVRSNMEGIYQALSREDILELGDVIVDTTDFEAPADRMFAQGIRYSGLDAMMTHNIAEGVPMAMKLTEELRTISPLDTLIGYAGDSLLVEPDHEVLKWLDILEASDSDKAFTAASNWPDPGTHNHIQLVRDAIIGDPGPYEVPEPFKQIHLVYADDAAVTLPDRMTGLHISAYDLAKGDSVYSWRKVHGAGEVSFYPNGTATARDTTVLFDGTPGQYLFEVKMSDSRGFTEATETIAVILYDAGGGLPTNNPPTANPQPNFIAEPGIPAQLILTGADPEGFALTYTVTSGPSEGRLTGTPPNLVYTADAGYSGPDSITFEVTDSEGQVDSATVSITVGAGSPVGLAIYEPFSGYPVDGTTTINGLSGTGEIGLDGTWTSGTNIRAEDPGYTYGPLPVTGSKLWHNGGVNEPMSRSINVDALTNSGLLADGATLWFSALIGADDTYLRNVKIALANASFDSSKSYIKADGADPGTGLGFELNADKNFYAAQYLDVSEGDPLNPGAPILGDFNEAAAGKFVRFGDLRLVVAKITWGAASDTVEMYLPLLPSAGESIVLPDEPSSTLVANVDQSKFDVLTLSRGNQVWVDEIRVGATLQSVLMGTLAGAANDGVAPEPNPMTFAVAPQASSANSITMTATPALDPLGVEYYFACTSGGGNDSGWQDSNVYTDTGLTPGVAYSYTVKARDKTPGLNETAPSASASATIPALGTVPDLVGIEQSVAVSLLTDAGMTVGTVTDAVSYSLTVRAGYVISQTPTGSTSAGYGSTVDLVISIGQDPALPTISPVDFVDNHGGGPVTLPAQFVYTLTFSQDMDISTIDAGDFVSLAGFPIIIGAINQTSPGVVTVEVVPDSLDSGLLLLAIAQGAVIKDASGNALNTTSVIADDNAIPIVRPANYLPVVDAGPDQNLSTQTPQPWSPSSMTVTAWYDAADLGSITQSGGGVSQWNDKSGNALHATQTNTSTMPVTGTRTVNGKNVIDFTTTSNHALSIPATDIIGKEVWAVMLVDDYSSAGSQLVMGGSNNSQIGIQSSTQQLRLWQSSNPYAGDSKSALTVPQGAATLLGWMAHTDTKKYSINGVLEDTGNTYTSGAMAPNNIGRGQYATMDGVIAEVIVTNGALSVAERERVEGYLAHKWGLEENLPAGHPYKSAAPTEPSWAASLDGTVSDDDGDPLTTLWTQLSGPAASSISDAAAVDTSAVFPAAGTYVLRLSADDGSTQVSDQVTITVIQGADTTPPTLASSSIVDDRGGADVAKNELVTYTVTFSEDMDAATVGASDFSNAGTSSVTIGSITEISPGAFTVEATPTSVGSLQLQISAGAVLTDVAGNALDTSSAIADDTTITVTESVSNDAPVFTVDPIAGGDATEDSAYSGTISGSATDADNDPLTYAKVSGPDWLSVADNGTLSGMPTNGDVGANSFTVSVTDSIAAPVNATLNITVINMNDVPVFANDPINASDGFQDVPYSGTLTGTATDADGDPLTYAKESGPAWLSVAADGTLSGNPTSGDLGANSFTVSVSDSIAAPVTATLNINILEPGGEEVVTLAEVFAHNERDNYSGIPFDLINGSGMNGHPDTGIAGWPTGEGMPSTWTATLNAYRAEHQSRDFLLAQTPSEDLDPTGALLPDGVGPTNGKIGWYVIDIGSVTTGLKDLHIWHIREVSSRIAADFNVYVAEAPAVAVPHGPTGSNARDYDFTSGGWTQVATGVAGVFQDVTITPLNGATARYIGLEIMANGGATDERVGFAEVGLTRTSVAGDTTPPTLAGSDIIDDQGGANVTEGNLVTYTVTFSEDMDEATVDASDFSNAGTSSVSIGAVTETSPGVFTVEATPTDAGTLQIQVSGSAVLTDVAGNALDAASAIIDDTTITVDAANVSPTWASDPVNEVDAFEDAAYAATLADDASDTNGDSLTFAKVSGPVWLNVAANGDLSGMPSNSDVGLNTFTVSVSDGVAAAVEASLDISVINTNDTPFFTVDPIAGSGATEDVTYVGSIAGTATDEDGDALSYAKVSGPVWLSVAANGDLSGIPSNADVGTNVFTVSVSDGTALPVQATLSITVINTNDAPAFVADPITGSDATEDTAYAGSIASSAMDDDNDALTYAKVSGPAWLGVAADGTVSGTPGNDDVGVNSFTVSATDSIADPVNAILTITVINANDAPVFLSDPIAGSDATEDTVYSGSLAGSATDDDDDALTYAKVSGPAWLGVAGDGTLSGTSANGDVGANVFTVSVTDGTAAPVSATLNVTVINTNDAPVFSADPIAGADATEDEAYVGTIAGMATDDDGDTLVYAKVSGPAWLVVASDGALSGTPASGDVGANSFTVSVSDSIDPAVNATLNITVNSGEDATAPNPDPMTWAVLPAPATGAGSGAMSLSTSAPVDDGADISNNGVVSGESLAWTDRPVSGQSFTTGAEAVDLKGLTLMLEDGLQTKTYVVRVGTISGTTFTEIHSETFTQNFDIGVNEYVTWEFLAPVSLAANTEYGIDVGLADSTSGWATGIPGIKYTSDAYAGGSYYTSGNGGAGDGTITTFPSEDLVFHLDMVASGGTSEDSITMTATTATDESGVEYYFTEISGNPGGSDSGWQDSPDYTDTGLQAATEYTYTVTARDKSTNQNTTAPSAPASATTLGSPPNDPPTWTADPIGKADATEGVSYGASLAGDATDLEGDLLAYAKVSGPAWLTVAANGDLSGTPADADKGANVFTVSVDDGNNPAVEATLNLTVIGTTGVPNVVGLAQAAAESGITAAGLVVGNVATAYDSGVPAGDVISQTPGGGVTVNEESSVDLVVSLGPPMATVPNVVGLPQATAEADIVAASLTVGSITEQYDETVPAGSVISQGLSAGASVPQGSAVDLSVSLGAQSSTSLVRTTVSGVSSAAWTTVNLGRTYNSLVVVATPIYPPGVTVPVATRITNVTSTGFDVKLDRADGQSGAVSLDVSIIAVEEGVYTQAVDGVTMEAVKFTSSLVSYAPNGWTGEARNFQNAYTNPVVVGQVMSANDTNWSVFWSMGSNKNNPVDSSNLNVGLHVGEDTNTARANETIGYIVIEAGAGTIDGVGYEAALGGDTIQGFDNSSTPFTYSLSGSLASASSAAASISGMDSNNGAWAVLAGNSPVSSTSIGLYACEDQIGDSEQNHTTTQVGYIVFE